MSEEAPKRSRAIPMNAAVIAPLVKIRATIGRDEQGNLVVSNQSSEEVDLFSPEERERRERIGEKVHRYVAGDTIAWDSELQQHYEAEKDRYLGDSPEAA